MDFKTEIIKSMETVIGQKLNNCHCDRTYKSVIKSITPKGYVILDTTGSERTVYCCIPWIEFKVGQSVWVKEPMGDLKGIHICGVVVNTKKSGGRR